MRAIAILWLTSACVIDNTTHDHDPYVQSHVETWDLPASTLPEVDVLLVVDDTAAFAPYRENLARLPAALDAVMRAPDGIYADLRIGVVSTDGTGALRTSSLVDGAFIVDRYNYDGSRETNYTGSLAEAIASLLPQTASRTTANRPLASMQAALGSDMFREYSTVTVLTISASDDVSLGAPSTYADAIKGTRADPFRIMLASAFPAGSPRLDAFHLLFPNRTQTEDIATIDYTSSDVVIPLVGYWTSDSVCADTPVDADPTAAGEQYDCSFSSLIDDVEAIIPPCTSGASPCWELVDQQWCVSPRRLTFRGYPGDAWPHIQGQGVTI